MHKFKIIDVPWHIGHQYEMLKFPFAEFDWLYQYLREYNQTPRGDLEGLELAKMADVITDVENKEMVLDKLATAYRKKMFDWVVDYRPGKYDVAILHLDQQCIEDGILAAGKGSVYRHINEVIQDIPKIVIMHGTPYYPEMFPNQQDIIKRVNDLVGDNYFICNSERALEQWGRKNDPKSRVIIHGLDPKEWWDLPKEPRVVTMISPGGLPAYYDRTFLEYIREGLEERDIQHCHITVDYEPKTFDQYRNFLGRSLLYINPTRESPMPRSRTEAMLSGCCVLTTPNQDADKYIKDGVNGFIIPRNPQYVVELVSKLLNDYGTAVRIGQAGKQTAITAFDINRYQNDWLQFINFVIADWKKNHAS